MKPNSLASPAQYRLRRVGVMTAALSLLFAGVGCSYVTTFVRQSYYRSRMAAAPSQRTFKHILQNDTFFVYGKVVNGPTKDVPLAVIAFGPGAEVVDSTQCARGETHYGLNLPAGAFDLVLVGDRDGNGVFEPHEAMAGRTVHLDTRRAPDRVVPGVDLNGGQSQPPTSGERKFRLAVRRATRRHESAFFPRGTLRSLDDELFSPRMAALGLYEPAAFLEEAPMMFYALEEDLGYKVPVIFVHGINGSARDFAPLIARLDRQGYRVWLYQYPSGAPLEQLGAMFYEIFLSGRAIPRPEIPVVIVAHSMGGLVVREALSRMNGNEREAEIGALLTIASPMGGHPAAAMSVHGPVVIPSWRDLAADSRFVQRLHRRKLPRRTPYYLAYAFQGDDPHAGSDGTVPVASQRAEAALAEASERIGFQGTHMGVLNDPRLVEWAVERIQRVKTTVPSDHLRELQRGGYQIALPDDFTPIERYFVRYIGCYMDALVDGRLQPLYPLQKEFVEECRNGGKASQPTAIAWRKLQKVDPTGARFAKRGFPDEAGMP